jgi:hypothetical protein
MNFLIADVLLAVVLFVAMLGAQEWGRRLGERHRSLDSKSDKWSYGASEGAVFALLGLFLAFTFSGAGSRFDARRHLIVDEANAIGTAWLRIDVLPENRRPELRQLFRDYLDTRLETYRLVAAGERPDSALDRSARLQQQIWVAATQAAAESGQVPPFTVLLPALNEMFDIRSTRIAAAQMHSPVVVYVMIGVLALIGAMFVGYGMAGREVRSFIHTIGFAAAMCVVLYVILDLEFPRLGLVRIDATDRVLVELRASMQ